VGPKAHLDAVEKKKITFPCLKSNLDSSVIQPIAYSLYRLSYPGSFNIK
jgi:hypothetical protein